MPLVRIETARGRQHTAHIDEEVSVCGTTAGSVLLPQ